MQLLYFGWVRTRIGTGSEEIDLPAEISDVRALIEWLQSRGQNYLDALKEIDSIRIAVNQELAELDAPVAGTDEVAVFPPMTGG
ncbi:MAG: molybdopterin synthase sulfur carrier subunit [Alphaproteobacteria bacterium]|jgi:molybdopterin synthase sulfur carrier subunit